MAKKCAKPVNIYWVNGLPDNLDANAIYFVPGSPTTLMYVTDEYGNASPIGGEGGTSVHNDLEGLQGGTTGQYYHLTQAQFENLGTGTPTLQQVLEAGSLGVVSDDISLVSYEQDNYAIGLEIIAGSSLNLYKQSITGSQDSAGILMDINQPGIQVYDLYAGIGLQYAADYSGNNTSNPRWLTDRGYVDSAIAAAGTLQGVITASETPGNLIYAETDNLIEYYVTNGTEYTTLDLDPIGAPVFIGSTGMVLRVVNGDLNVRSDSGRLLLTGLSGIEANQPILGKDATLPKHYVTLDQLNAAGGGTLQTVLEAGSTGLLEDGTSIGIGTFTDNTYSTGSSLVLDVNSAAITAQSGSSVTGINFVPGTGSVLTHAGQDRITIGNNTINLLANTGISFTTINGNTPSSNGNSLATQISYLGGTYGASNVGLITLPTPNLQQVLTSGSGGTVSGTTASPAFIQMVALNTTNSTSSILNLNSGGGSLLLGQNGLTIQQSGTGNLQLSGTAININASGSLPQINGNNPGLAVKTSTISPIFADSTGVIDISTIIAAAVPTAGSGLTNVSNTFAVGQNMGITPSSAGLFTTNTRTGRGAISPGSTIFSGTVHQVSGTDYTATLQGVTDIGANYVNTYFRTVFNSSALTGNVVMAAEHPVTRVPSQIKIDALTGIEVSDSYLLKGMVYAGNYNTFQLANDRAITDVGGVKSLINQYAIVQNGNTFGTTMRIGTLDNNHVDILRNNLRVARFNAAGIILGDGTSTGAGVTNFAQNSVITLQADGSTQYYSDTTSALPGHYFIRQGTGTGDIATFMSPGLSPIAGVKNDGRVYGLPAVDDEDYINKAQLESYAGFNSTEDNFDYTSGAQTFVLTSPPVGTVTVFVNGVRLRNPTQYTLVGSTVTITNTLDPGDWVAVDYNA